MTGSRTWANGSAVRLEIRLKGKNGLEVALELECHEGQSIVRQWLGVSPSATVTIDRVEPGRLVVAGGDLSTVHTVSGVQRQGGWRPDNGPYRSFRLEHESLQSPVRRESGLRSTWDETPWLALTADDASTGGLLMALEYGGRWELDASRVEAGETTVAAFAPAGIVPEVKPRQTWTSPSIWIGSFPGDLDSAAAVMHRYLRDVVVPKTDAHFPWVQYNTWFSWYCELDAETLLAEADIAAGLGVEVFYVDAGWWVGNPVRKDRFSSGLGNWVENREKFPDGLKSFADGIRSKGMHFGLWVEPERVDLRTVTTGTWKPEWIAREHEGRYIRCDWPSDTETAWLCFGHAEAQDWATEWIGALVEDLGIRWLKWDSNYWGVCTSPDHGHGVGDAEAAQVEGVQIVMARLRERFPNLVIENCAGGATRMDFALARQTPVAWLNDASEPAHRSRFHNAGASYLFPPEMLNAWVTESEHENVNGQDQTDEVWRAVIRSRMLGAIGFSCKLATWSDRTRAVAGEEIERYKSELRPILKTGSFHHLLLQPEIPSARLPTPDVWEAYQISAADGSRHLILGFRNLYPGGALPVQPANIEAAATYEVTADGGLPTRQSGADLLANGLALDCPLLASTWVTIQRVSGQ
ncbi:MAG: alpha-galactosidase [Chloroflexota bacterium]|nr:alpha-galactosidase [Chloroflexota bacterium]